MRRRSLQRGAAILLGVTVAVAGPATGDVVSFNADTLGEVDVVFIGEIHDNPDHHLLQAEIIALLDPAAVVFEMLTPEEAMQAAQALAEGGDVGEATGWDTSGWPAYELYAPIFDAMGGAAIYGAEISRSEAQAAFSTPLAEVFGTGAARFGLIDPLPEAEQAEREAEQQAAHCNALPDDLLPGFVAAQRLRDARLAAVTLTALDETGGQVIVITGNGHARPDRGAPFLLSLAQPEVSVWTIGQFESREEVVDSFDDRIVGPATDRADRPDPCAAFD